MQNEISFSESKKRKRINRRGAGAALLEDFQQQMDKERETQTH